MQVKKFEAPTMKEALDLVKKDLGPEAIILQTKKSRKGLGFFSKPFIEVTAAISEKDLKSKKNVDSRIPNSMKESYQNLSAMKQMALIKKYERNAQKNSYVEESAALSQLELAQEKNESSEIHSKDKKITATRYIDIQDKDEVTLPAPVPDQKKPALYDLGLENLPLKKDIPALNDAFEQLILNGIDKKYALLLMKKVLFELGSDGCQDVEKTIDRLAQEMMDSIQVISSFSAELKEGARPIVLAFVGPTGVGKTSSIAKLAAQMVKKNSLKVGFINLDHSKRSFVDQLMTYSKILQVPFRSAHSAEDLNSCLNDFHFLDMIFVDTPGFSQKDQESLQKTQNILSSVSQLHSYLVLSSVTRDVEMYDAAHRFSSFHPLGLVMTKLDEAVICGGIYNVSQRTKLPFAYFTTGQRIPEDLESASAERLVSMILEID